MNNTKENKNGKKPFYKDRWFYVVIAAMLIYLMFGSNDKSKDADKTLSKDWDKTSTIAETTNTPIKENSKLEFELVAGEQGDYGKIITYNKGTEFEENFYAYYIPAGTYTVTNVGKYMDQINVYSDQIKKSEDGWDEPAEVYVVKMIDVNKSEVITVENGQHIEIAEPAHLKFEQQ